MSSQLVILEPQRDVGRRARRWMGLRMQMTLSYIVITLAAVLFSEGLRYLLYLILPLPTVPVSVLLGVDLFLLMFVPLIGSLFGIISTRGPIRRIQRLARVTELFASGHYDQRLVVSRNDEVGILEANFNQMAQQLVESIELRQRLAEREARQHERSRIARDLHDSVKQQAFAVSMQIGAALALLDERKEDARACLLEAEALSSQVQQELAAFIQELRASSLRDRGLVPVLQDYVSAWSRQHAIVAELRMPTACLLPVNVEEALLRITQEALSNVARHSGATTVSLELVCSGEEVTLCITDNGRGFVPESIAGSGVGLHSMRERMEELGGVSAIESAPGRGTRLNVRWTSVKEKV